MVPIFPGLAICKHNDASKSANVHSVFTKSQVLLLGTFCSQLIHKTSLQGECSFYSPFHKRENEGDSYQAVKPEFEPRQTDVRAHFSPVLPLAFGIWSIIDTSPLSPVCFSSLLIKGCSVFHKTNTFNSLGHSPTDKLFRSLQFFIS